MYTLALKNNGVDHSRLHHCKGRLKEMLQVHHQEEAVDQSEDGGSTHGGSQGYLPPLHLHMPGPHGSCGGSSNGQPQGRDESLCNNYEAEAFLLQWDQFAALRGCPAKVVSDRGSQLTAAAHYISWPASQDPSGWDWDMVSSRSARAGKSWEFFPAGCQFRNGLAESRVKILKATLGHTLVGNTQIYAECSVVLSRAANIANDRPL